MRRLALLLVALLALLPAATAQAEVRSSTLTVFVPDPGPSLFPGDNDTLEVQVRYQFEPGGHPTPAPTADRPEDTAPTRITLAIKEMPSWVASAVIVPDVLEVRIDQRHLVAPRFELMAELRVQVAENAPAHQREPVVVTARAEPNGNIAGANAESAPTLVRVQPVGKLNVTAPDAAIIPGGRWSVVAFAVRNEGNDEFVTKLNVTLRPENSQVEFPTTIELPRGETRIVDVRVRTPWNAAEFGDLELTAIPIVDGQEGQAARASVELTGQSAVPAPPLPALLLGLALALAARRR